jgi:hypothetical protein
MRSINIWQWMKADDLGPTVGGWSCFLLLLPSFQVLLQSRNLIYIWEKYYAFINFMRLDSGTESAKSKASRLAARASHRIIYQQIHQ